MFSKIEKVSEEELEALCHVTARLTDEGVYAAAGWSAFEEAYLKPLGLSENQTRFFKFAFISGALHLFAGIHLMLPEGAEASKEDLSKINELFTARFQKLNDELTSLAKRFVVLSGVKDVHQINADLAKGQKPN